MQISTAHTVNNNIKHTRDEAMPNPYQYCTCRSTLPPQPSQEWFFVLCSLLFVLCSLFFVLSFNSFTFASILCIIVTDT